MSKPPRHCSIRRSQSAIILRWCQGREALLKCEEVLGSVVALEGLGDALGGALDEMIAHRGRAGISLTGEDGANDSHAADAGDVTDDLVKLDVHLGQGLLHALHVSGHVADESIALADVAAQHAGLIVGTERTQRRPKVSLLERLAVLDVALSAGQAFGVAASTSSASKPRVRR